MNIKNHFLFYVFYKGTTFDNLFNIFGTTEISSDSKVSLNYPFSLGVC